MLVLQPLPHSPFPSPYYLHPHPALFSFLLCTWPPLNLLLFWVTAEQNGHVSCLHGAQTIEGFLEKSERTKGLGYLPKE